MSARKPLPHGWHQPAMDAALASEAKRAGKREAARAAKKADAAAGARDA